AILSSSIPALAQERLVREARFGRGRITEILPQPVVVVDPYVSEEPPAKADDPKPKAGDPKTPPAAQSAPLADPRIPPRVAVPLAKPPEVELRDAIIDAQTNLAAAIRSL